MKTSSMSVTAVFCIVGASILGFAIGRLAKQPSQASEPAKLSVPAYDLDETRRDFAAIGSAIRLYREEQDVKATSAWKLPRDAGLPHDPFVLLSPNKPWSLAPDKLLNPTGRTAHLGKIGNSYLPLMWGPEIGSGSNDPAIFRDYSMLATRGEMLPIFVDYDIQAESNLFNMKDRKPAVILRLNGDIDIVLYDPSDPMDILRQ